MSPPKKKAPNHKKTQTHTDQRESGELFRKEKFSRASSWFMPKREEWTRNQSATIKRGRVKEKKTSEMSKEAKNTQRPQTKTHPI